MNIFLAALVAIMGILGAIALRCIDDRFETVIRAYNANTTNIMTHVEANKNRALNNADMIEKNAEAILVISNDFQDHNNDINMICVKLESIVQDIHRLDEDISKVSADEKEIRSYYVNYRDPQVPNGGAPWASEYKTGEDND